jgi:hypothetical protein
MNNMDIKILDKFSNLPDVLIHKIINYSDVLTYRNGKYINRINKNDKRYNLLKKITRPIFIGNNKVLLRLINYDMIGYFIEYEFKNDSIILNVKVFCREIDGYDKYFNIKSNEIYLFDINNNLTNIYYIN